MAYYGTDREPPISRAFRLSSHADIDIRPDPTCRIADDGLARLNSDTLLQRRALDCTGNRKRLSTDLVPQRDRRDRRRIDGSQRRGRSEIRWSYPLGKWSEPRWWGRA